MIACNKRPAMYAMQEPTNTRPLERQRETVFTTANRRLSLKRKRETVVKETKTSFKRPRQDCQASGQVKVVKKSVLWKSGRLGPVGKAAQLRLSEGRRKRECRKRGTVDIAWVPMDTDSAASDDVELLVVLFQRLRIGEKDRMGSETQS